eukprot:2479811-Amphidinium_carterae.2
MPRIQGVDHGAAGEEVRATHHPIHMMIKVTMTGMDMITEMTVTGENGTDVPGTRIRAHNAYFTLTVTAYVHASHC